jgi:hypothetical protein
MSFENYSYIIQKFKDRNRSLVYFFVILELLFTKFIYIQRNWQAKMHLQFSKICSINVYEVCYIKRKFFIIILYLIFAAIINFRYTYLIFIYLSI